MDKENISVTKSSEPEAIGSAKELISYQENFDTGFHFTDKEAEIIIDYMEGHDYLLGHKDGVLYRGDLDDKPEEIVWEEFPMDDVIDSVCEWNYEFILDMDAERQNAINMIEFSNRQSRYEGLKEQEQVLDKLFDQTRYATKIEIMAEQLADAFIASLAKGKDVDEVAHEIAESVKQASLGGRSR